MGNLYINIKKLWGVDQGLTQALCGKGLSNFKEIENAFILSEKGRISDFGEMKDLQSNNRHKVIDLRNAFVFPTFCDSHSHLVFAGPRDGEFEDRIKGMTYEEIANRGGGIINSAKKLREMSEDELFVQAKKRLREIVLLGTGSIEIKSGYGLSYDSEIKMLKVIRRLKELNWIPIKSTLLAAHAIPPEFRNDKSGYLKLIGEKIIPDVAKEKLADYVDVFCEKGYFDTEDTKYILDMGKKFELKGKIHVNQFNAIGGIKIGVDSEALSVDHLEVVEDEDLKALKNSKTISTILPSCSFFLSIPYAPARKLIDAGLPVALASDYNPGSTPSGNMNFVVSLACIKQNMTPEEAFNAATFNGACAMELQNEVGSIAIGKRSNFVVTKEVPSLAYIPYSFGHNLVDRVVINGEVFQES